VFFGQHALTEIIIVISSIGTYLQQVLDMFNSLCSNNMVLEKKMKKEIDEPIYSSFVCII
jgi:hypothetical protein